MEYLTLHETPSVELTYLVTAFKGWPDAGEGASGALRYMMRKLRAKKLADLESEEFYNFTETRPQTSLSADGNRVVKWPSNELFYSVSPNVLFFLGVEPNLKWRSFSRAILEPAQSWGLKTVMHLGSLLDAVPHTRDVRISGSSNDQELKEGLERQDVHSSNYQGPTGITSAMMEACNERDLGNGSMWGHTPHYIQAAPNYRVSYALVSRLTGLLDVEVPLDELRSAADTFDREVEKAVTGDGQIGAYVKKLEERYDEAMMLAQGEIPQAEDMVRELEEFLKNRREAHGENGPAH